MIRHYFLTLFFIIFSLVAYSQHTEVKGKITDDLPQYNTQKHYKKSAAKPKTCGNDTVEYARRKASAYNSISMRKNYSLGQIYGAPQDITVHGFTFYAWAVASPPTDKTIRVICNIYRAGADSLPSGTPLRSDTVTIDSTFGGGLLSKLEKRCTFKSPVTVNYPYVLTVESDSTSLSAGLVANSWTNADGDSANLLCGSVSGRWYRGLSLNIGGTRLNADMQFYPHVSYTFGTDFTVPECFNFKDSARFKNASSANVAGSKFYSLYSFYNIEQYTHQWNYGEMPWAYNGINGIYKYNGKGNFNIRLVTYMYQWRGNSPCLDTAVKILYFKPKNPVAISKTNICRGDDANIEVASDTGTTIKWYKNPSGNVVFTGNTNKLGKIQNNDTFYIKAINYGCESGFTLLIITVNDYPKHPITRNDSICFGAKANLEAKSSIGLTEWYTDSTFLPFYNGNVFQTGSLSKDASYYVRSNNNECYSPYFKTVTAYVDNSFAPDEPIVSNDTSLCFRPLGKALLKAYSIANDSLRWFDLPNGGNSIASGNAFTFTPKAVGTAYIYVEAQKSTCASSRLGIKISTHDYPSISQVFGDERCKGDTAQVGALLSDFGTVNWYTAPTGGTLINKGSVIRYYTKKSINLFPEAEDNGCINPIRSVANIKINAYDSITKIDVPLVCGNAKVTMKVTAGTNVVKWYEDEATTKLLASTAAYTTPNLLVSTNYYFKVSKNGCTSPVYTVLAEVLPLPISGYNYSFISGHRMSFVPYVTTGVTYKWFMGDGNTYTSKFVTHKYASYGTYSIKLIVKFITSGCSDSASQDILYDFSGVKPVANQPQIAVYPNPASSAFTVRVNPELSHGKLSILSMEGKLVSLHPLGGQTELKIEETLSKGTYIIRVQTGQLVGYEKLIIR